MITVLPKLFLVASLSLAAWPGLAQPVYLDLSTRFEVDAILEPGGTALSDPLEDDRERIDGNTLPSAHVDGVPSVTVDGRTTFKFAPLRSSSRDAVTVNGQVLTVPAAAYGSLDLALLSAPGSYANPFNVLELRYSDGSIDQRRWGPVPGWVASPTAFDHSFFSYTDDSGVQALAAFDANWGAEEAGYILQQRGNGNADGVRFVDGTGYVLYDIPIDPSITDATLGVTVGNNFVISIATTFANPEISLTEGYTVLANSMELYDGFEHMALGNLRLYEFNLQPFLAGGPGGVYLLLTDATPGNGWGPYIQNVSVYTGENIIFSDTLAPALDTEKATVHAEFLTNGEQPEAPYLYDNSAYGPSNRRHRFADAGGSLTYRFDLPDEVSDAQLTVDMANNFVVSLSGPIDQQRYALMTPGSPEEASYLVDAGNSSLGGNFRFADGTAYMIYEFDLPDEVTSAVAQITVGNQFVIGVAAGSETFVTERDYVLETGIEIRDNSNLDVYEVDLSNYLVANPAKIIRIRLSDGQPADGWGPYLTRISIVAQAGSGQGSFQTVLHSADLFGGLDIHNEINKGYYTIDLSSVLADNNPGKEVFVKFTDGSTADGWGPGVFWIAVHSGPIEILSDRQIFANLKALNGDPQGFGLNLLQRRYPVDPTKTLEQISLPTQSPLENSQTYLLAATLNPAATDVRLSAEFIASDTLQLSWPASATGYVLESSVALADDWFPTTEIPTLEGDRYVVTIPTSGNQRYFRLRD